MKKLIIASGVAALCLVGAGGVAVAQQAGGHPRGHAARGDADGDGRISRAEFVDGRVSRLRAVDADSDGSVTREEMQAAGQARREARADARFGRLDANSDGSISRGEFDAAAEARPDRRERRAERGGPGRGGPGMRMGRGPDGGRGGMGPGTGADGERGPVAIAQVESRMGEAFARLDADSDGYLTAEERRAGRDAMRGERRERMRDRRAARQASPSATPSE